MGLQIHSPNYHKLYHLKIHCLVLYIRCQISLPSCTQAAATFTVPVDCRVKSFRVYIASGRRALLGKFVPNCT